MQIQLSEENIDEVSSRLSLELNIEKRDTEYLYFKVGEDFIKVNKELYTTFSQQVLIPAGQYYPIEVKPNFLKCIKSRADIFKTGTFYELECALKEIAKIENILMVTRDAFNYKGVYFSYETTKIKYKKLVDFQILGYSNFAFRAYKTKDWPLDFL